MGILDDFFNSDSTTDLYGGHVGSIDHHTSSLGINSSDLYGDYGQYIGNIEVCGNKVYRYNSEGRIVSSGTYYPESDTLDMMNEDGRLEVYNSTNSEKIIMFDKDGDSIYNPFDYKYDGYTKNNDEFLYRSYCLNDSINDLNNTRDGILDEYFYSLEHSDSIINQFLENCENDDFISEWDNDDAYDDGWSF